MTTRPEWLTNDIHWSVFKDYRDSKQSADDLAVLYQMSRAQVQNIVRNVIERCGRPGELSARAVKVLKSCGLTLAPEQQWRELQELKERAARTAGTLEAFFSGLENCGRKTTQELLEFYEAWLTPSAIDPAA